MFFMVSQRVGITPIDFLVVITITCRNNGVTLKLKFTEYIQQCSLGKLTNCGVLCTPWTLYESEYNIVL